MRLTTRVAALEARPREIRGWRTFHTHDEVTFYENERNLPGDTFGYRSAIVGMGGPDTEIPGSPTFSQADLDAIEADGFGVVVIRYVDGYEWLHGVQEGLQDAQTAP